MCNNKSECFWSILRIEMGLVFLWAFLDKIFGWGFNTEAGKAWLDGVSPTFGFLKFATNGPFATFYQSLAGNPVVDWLFMLGLVFVGITLTLGIFSRLGASVGALMLLLMYTAGFMPPVHHPFIDEHIVNATIMLALAISGAGKCCSLEGLCKKCAGATLK